MKFYRFFHLFISLTLFWSFSACQSDQNPSILVFTAANKSVHDSRENGKRLLDSLGRENNWEITFGEDPNMFNEEQLSKVNAIIFLNASGNIFSESQKSALIRFVEAGGGIVGVHAAATVEPDWPWFGEMLGGRFKDHPKIQSATIINSDPENSATSHFDNTFSFKDEWYNFKLISPDIHPLLQLDESSYEGGSNGKFHPIAWIKKMGRASVFYTGLGHLPETYSDPGFIRHLEKGIKSILTDSLPDYRFANSTLLPQENRFEREILTQNLNEPMELDFTDENTLLFIQRHGELFKMNLTTRELKLIQKLNVFSELEEGLIGLAVDPSYQSNHWIYLFYSSREEPVQKVSRFDYYNDVLDLSSEKVILTVPVQRETCCHVAGSIEFGPDGLLYIATGDNTNPFESEGYAPMDERPGRGAWDAQRTSANTNSLNGKILRIRPLPDGTYEIPEGNLFPVNTEKTRPEIYIMGLRNPFRISIDAKTGWLYWGDVGPDAGRDGVDRGPKGYDEINQAKVAGFYGWPFTRGNNFPYFDYNFAKKESGKRFNPDSLINDSPHNNGLNLLPPAKPSFIYYPYDSSAEFPWTGTGGRSAMAGPVYHLDLFPANTPKFPEFLDGKLIAYEWMRDWIYLIETDKQGNYLKAWPFLGDKKFNNPVDMAFGPDGNLYIMEYGEAWNSRNQDARINRISYNTGNRPPLPKIKLSESTGKVPLDVKFTAIESRDPDGDKLRFEWTLKGKSPFSSLDTASYTFENPGIYTVVLTAIDRGGRKSSSETTIYAGNAAPEIKIDLMGEATNVFWDKREIEYEITISDAEDGIYKGSDTPPGKTKVQFGYLRDGEDLAVLGHQTSSKSPGMVAIDASDCRSCHDENKRINGPSFAEIASRYSQKEKEFLINKIIEGGAGNWGESAMSAHPQLDKETTGIMVDYILSLSENNKQKEISGLPLKGKLDFTEHLSVKGNGKYVLQVSYEDSGNGSLPGLSTQKTLFFQPNVIYANQIHQFSNSVARAGNDLKIDKNASWFSLPSIKGEKLARVFLHFYVPGSVDEIPVEIHKDAVDGALMAKSVLKNANANSGLVLELPRTTEVAETFYIVFPSIKTKDGIFYQWGYFGYQ